MKLLAVDSNSILNRAFYGIKLLTTKDGAYTNAIYGFLNIVLKIMEDQRPDAVAFAFDLRAPTFRHKMYDGYKAQRKGMPQELADQLPLMKEVLTLMGYPIVTQEGFEADDILGTLAKGCGDGNTCVIATGDRDSLQLVDDQISVLLATTKMGTPTYTMMDPAAVWTQYGVQPLQLIDVKALQGDTSDNIPGVPGVGEKTALSLIGRYHDLDTVYRDLSGLEVTPSVRRKLTEGRDLAYMSRDLARINTQVPIETNPAVYCKSAGDPAGLYRLLARLELFTMITRLNLPQPGDFCEEEGQAVVRRTVTLKQGCPVEELIQGLGEGAVLDLVPAGPLAQAGLAVGDGERVWIFGPETGAGALSTILALPCGKRAISSKELFRYAYNKSINIQNVVFDAELAAYLLNPNSSNYLAERLCSEYGVQTPGLTLPDTVEEPLRVAALDCAAMAPLCTALERQIEEKEQQKLLGEIEIPLARVLASMEELGFAIDLAGLAAFGEEMKGEISRLEEEIYQLAGCTFNINSPKQMGDILFGDLALPHGKKTKTGYSTNADVLEGLRGYHPIVGKILDYRKYAKLQSTYVEGLSKQAVDGRIHSVFNQTETRTGRISSAEPNLQNIPIRTEVGARMRKFFPAREGCVLVDADYSQIELRVLASLAQDENMIGAFAAGEDIHTNTAAQVFDLPPLFVTPLMRSRAKAVNFGIVYGIGAFSLSKDIGVTVAEADKYIKNYLKTYSGVKRYMDESVQRGREDGFVTTLFGRRRYLPELASTNHNLRSFGERVAMNAPIQGTAADIIKIAMVRVFNRLRAEGLEAKLVLQVHDELIVEAPVAEADRAAAIVREEMEHAAQLRVPLVVDVGVGADWQEAH